MSLSAIESHMCDVHGIRSRIDAINDFLRQYMWLIDVYVSDFFVNDYWEKIRPSWREALCQSEVDEYSTLLNKNTWNTRTVWPLSLLAFHSTVHLLSLDQTPSCVQYPPSCEDRTQRGIEVCSAGGMASRSQVITDGQCMNLQHCYRRHVKPKKQHEIINMAKSLDELAQTCGCRHVVDVGAGQGHLSRVLSYGYGLRVTTVEAADCHAPKASKYDSEVQKDIASGKIYGRRKKKKCRNPGRESIEASLPPAQTERTVSEPNHVVAMVDPSVSVDEFISTLQLSSLDTLQSGQSTSSTSHALGSGYEKGARSDLLQTNVLQQVKTECFKVAPDLNNSSRDEIEKEGTKKLGNSQESVQDVTGSDNRINSPTPNFILTGLHACGDLTPTMMRVFVNCPHAVGLGSVGCCYMKLSTQGAISMIISHDGKDPGYPMSTYLQNSSNHHLSYEAREMACHFVSAYYDRLVDKSPNLQSHCYRAALQEIIVQKDSKMERCCIKLNIKQSQNLSFQRYATAALTRLKLDPELSDQQLSVAQERLKKWKDVVAFYTLRLSLAPVVETLILLDRALYLLDHEFQSYILPLFDPRISPRNFILLATKK